MTFRSRAFAALTLAALLPLALLAIGVRREMSRQMAQDASLRGDAAIAGLRDEVSRQSEAIAAHLATLAAEWRRDNRLRLALVEGDPAARRTLLDLAGGAMRAAGLDMLRIQDSVGRILSSGHFRNEFDRVEPDLPRTLEAAGVAPVLVRARTADTALLVLARLDTVRVAGGRLTISGGSAIGSGLRRQLARDPDLSLRVAYPGVSGAAADDRPVVGTLALPFVDLTARTPPDSAHLIVTRSAGALGELRRGIDRWFVAALAVTVALALSAAGWLAARISRPLSTLAEQTAGIDFDRLDQRFVSDRDDEIGALAGVLGAMTERLRTGATRLREAERRVATGDLARQVNHDVKNGLVPIRNVLRHLTQVAREEPGSLARVFEERRGTLESSLDYLDTLARNYARLSPAAERKACDVNAVVLEVVRGTVSPHATLRAAPDPAIPSVATDPLVLRRILENLVGNAVDSVAGRSDGVVTVGTELAGAPAGRLVRLTVTDTGPGMSRTELDRAFDDFHTTKPGGTGLGLSIVRRLVLDLGGALRIETAPGAGTRAIVELPIDPATTGDGARPGESERRRA
ncbi:MAG TPA: HAMP domain-containing sensor histidine kinase [Gemmatimonadales bacterium]|nr:HAMP domain-containing sensor histidine kinase [Gemmatimonadales bacterium]